MQHVWVMGNVDNHSLCMVKFPPDDATLLPAACLHHVPAYVPCVHASEHAFCPALQA